jgi:hypothetical protein
MSKFIRTGGRNVRRVRQNMQRQISGHTMIEEEIATT